ncbi:hypothetical protein ACFL0Y_01535 [Patescibacteria group bacterium]
MKRAWLVILASFLVLLLVIFFLRFVIGGSEDDWLCVDGQWVKHGVPSAPKPAEGCGDQEKLVKTPTVSEVSSGGYPVTIDFEKCQPIKQAIGVMFGSTTYEIKGKSGQFCLMDYGGEIENPEWSGILTEECRIPLNLGEMTFEKTRYKVNFSSIDQFCFEK